MASVFRNTLLTSTLPDEFFHSTTATEVLRSLPSIERLVAASYVAGILGGESVLIRINAFLFKFNGNIVVGADKVKPLGSSFTDLFDLITLLG